MSLLVDNETEISANNSDVESLAVAEPTPRLLGHFSNIRKSAVNNDVPRDNQGNNSAKKSLSSLYVSPLGAFFLGMIQNVTN